MGRGHDGGEYLPQGHRERRVRGEIVKRNDGRLNGCGRSGEERREERGVWLVDLFGFAGHVVHEEILAESVGSGEVGFAAAHFGDFLHEVDERIIAGEHEGVDHDAGALALVDLFESLADDERIQSEGIFVDTAVF